MAHDSYDDIDVFRAPMHSGMAYAATPPAPAWPGVCRPSRSRRRTARVTAGRTYVLATPVFPQAVQAPAAARGEDLGLALALAFKRAVDVLGGLTLLVLLSPLLLATGIALLVSGGSVLFAQPRVGVKGRTFLCLKFRTMVPNAEAVLDMLVQTDPVAREQWLRAQKLENDPRITRIGRILRKTSIDELPQLWNVVSGDMSLVGPRPILPDQRSRYGAQFHCYAAMRPGITGLWQVTARGDKDFEQRVRLDCEYVRSFGLVNDLRILLKTFGVVLSGRGAA